MNHSEAIQKLKNKPPFGGEGHKSICFLVTVTNGLDLLLYIKTVYFNHYSFITFIRSNVVVHHDMIGMINCKSLFII